MWGTLLDQTANIERATITKDASGGSVRAEPWPVVLANVPVSIQPLSSYSINIYAQQNIQVSHMIYTTTDLNTAISGKLLVDDRFSDANGTKYVVVGIRKQLNFVLSSEPLYEITCRQLIG